MSGLWTPDGERPAPKRPATENDPPDVDAEGARRELTAEEEATLAELARAEQQLLSAPVEDVIANHCYGLFQLAALHLGQQPPRLEASRLAIDALAAVVDRLGERLGGSTDTLRDGLAQIQLAYVQIAGVLGDTSAAGDASGSEPAPHSPSDQGEP
jgi:hypothetical protein